MSARPRAIDADLVRLAARRTMPFGLGCVLVAATVAAAWPSQAPFGASFEAPLDAASSAADRALSSGLARQSGLWLVVAVVIPFALARAAGVAAPWRQARRTQRDEDASWLAPRAASDATIAVSTWLGAWLATLVLSCATLLAIEVASGFGPVEARSVGSAAGPGGRWVTSTAPLTWRTRAPDETAPGAHGTSALRARLELGLGAGAGNAAAVEFSARDVDASTRASASNKSCTTRARIGNRGWVEVDWPAGARDVEFTLACADPEARVCVLSDALESWSRASTGAATWDMLLRLACASAAWTALVLALACRLGATTAVAGALVLLAPAWFGPVSWTDAASVWPRSLAVRAIPGADLLDALAIVGDGRAPGPAPTAEIVGAACVTIAALALTVAGVRAWRHAR